MPRAAPLRSRRIKVRTARLSTVHGRHRDGAAWCLLDTRWRAAAPASRRALAPGAAMVGTRSTLFSLTGRLGLTMHLQRRNAAATRLRRNRAPRCAAVQQTRSVLLLRGRAPDACSRELRAQALRRGPDIAGSTGAWPRRRCVRRRARLGYARKAGQRTIRRCCQGGVQNARRAQRAYQRASYHRLAQLALRARTHRVARQPAEHVNDAANVRAQRVRRRPDEECRAPPPADKYV